MFIECVKNKGVDYLRVIDGFKYKENGKLKHKRRVVKNIGPLSRFSDGQAEYLARLRKSFKMGKPLIAELEELLSDEPIREKITVEFDVLDEKSYCTHKKRQKKDTCKWE